MAVVAKTTAFVAGSRTPVKRGVVYDDDDPVVRSHPHLFESTDAFAVRTRRPQSTKDLGHRSMLARGLVEQATAAPGEARAVSHPCDVEGCDSVWPSRRALKAHQRSHEDTDE